MNRQRLAWAPAAVWAAVLFFASSRQSVGVDLSSGLDKVAHFGAYLILGVCLQFAARRNRLAPLAAIGIGVLYGFLDEFHQHFVPGRFVEFADWVADSLGVIAGVMLYARLGPIVGAVKRARAAGTEGSREDANVRRREEQYAMLKAFAGACTASSESR